MEEDGSEKAGIGGANRDDQSPADLGARVERALGEGLCPRCLGRLFARLGHGYDNRQRGMALAMWARAGGETGNSKENGMGKEGATVREEGIGKEGATVREEGIGKEGATVREEGIGKEGATVREDGMGKERETEEEEGTGDGAPSMDHMIDQWTKEGEPDHIGVGPADCSYCRGLMDELNSMAEAVVSKLSDMEFDNYLIGTKYDPIVVARQEELWELIGPGNAEHIKLEVNREVGKLVGDLTTTSVEFKKPDVTILLDTRFDSVQFQISSIFFYGLYRKLERGLPQTRWPCRNCGGIGCRRCGFKGKLYKDSVQELVAEPFMQASRAQDNAFHGMGREDIDARMLGEGRPFILELIRPRIRGIDLGAMGEAVNRAYEGRVEVEGLRPSDWGEVQSLKGASPDKSYTARVAFSQPVSDEKLKMVEITFAGTPLEQRTPERVSHRRADLVRERTVRSINVESLGPQTALMHVRAESGTYIKELIHGDDGRTRPNVSDLLGVQCKVVELDVTAVHLADGGEDAPAGK